MQPVSLTSLQALRRRLAAGKWDDAEACVLLDVDTSSHALLQGLVAWLRPRDVFIAVVSRSGNAAVALAASLRLLTSHRQGCVVGTRTRTEDAARPCLTMAAMLAHALLPVSTRMYIQSNDPLVVEVKAQLACLPPVRCVGSLPASCIVEAAASLATPTRDEEFQALVAHLRAAYVKYGVQAVRLSALGNSVGRVLEWPRGRLRTHVGRLVATGLATRDGGGGCAALRLNEARIREWLCR